MCHTGSGQNGSTTMCYITAHEGSGQNSSTTMYHKLIKAVAKIVELLYMYYKGSGQNSSGTTILATAFMPMPVLSIVL